MKYLFSFFFILTFFNCLAQEFVISGNLSDESSGEAILFATITVEGTTIGTVSNEYGFYSITIKEGLLESKDITLIISCIGYDSKKVKHNLESGSRLDLKMSTGSQSIKKVTISAERTKEKQELQSTQMSAISIPMQELKSIPSIGGETDIIKVIQLMPGIQGGGEGGTGMFVRGGDADQNLVLLDEATVYNIGHLFGFFSVFNSDVIKDITLYKGAFPANYGGRLSSILDIKMKEGNLNEIHGQGGIGLLSSRLAIEGPIKKGKGSFLIAGRRTYIDQVFKAVGQTLPYHFYDLNLKANYILGENDRLYFSNYLGNDILRFDGSDVDAEDGTDLGFGFTLGNFTNTLRWNHIYNDKLFSNTSLIHTKFDYDINGRFGGNNILIKSDVRDIGVSSNFSYFKSDDLTYKFGASITEHIFKPNVVSTSGDISEFLASSQGDKLNNLEFGIYGNAEKSFHDNLYKLSGGIRFSGSDVKGKTYLGIEPRIAFRYLLNENDAIKVSYSRMKQYMHRVSSSSVTLPTDLWYPVTENIKPQSSDQVAIAYNHLFDAKKISFVFEAYYKKMDNLIEYREGANLILNDNFESELLQGKGDSYGAEVLFKKDEGKLSGWIAYTLSWSTRNFEELNFGETYWAKYDRRHVFNAVGTYKISERLKFSAVWTYSSGSRFTAQVGQYFVPNSSFTGVDIIPVYSKRNEISMSPSHRLDINFILGPRPNKEKKFKSEWHFGAYNFYNRATPYRIEIVPSENGLGYQYSQPGLFGFIPSVSYNFNF